MTEKEKADSELNPNQEAGLKKDPSVEESEGLETQKKIEEEKEQEPVKADPSLLKDEALELKKHSGSVDLNSQNKGGVPEKLQQFKDNLVVPPALKTLFGKIKKTQ